ncbi:MAG: putative metal-binding motif-containing protein, partial [Acidobacteriota bacterium]
MRPYRTILSLSFLCVMAFGAVAQTTPPALKIQGYLSDRTGGTPVPASGVHSITFAIYDVLAGGVPLVTVGPLAVDVFDGRYEAEIPILPDAFDGSERYLELTVNGELLAPRIRIVSTPFAFRADRADVAAMVEAGSVDSDSFVAGSVDAAALADGSVTPGKLASFCAVGEILVQTAGGWMCGTPPGGGVICPPGSYIHCPYGGPTGTDGVGECSASISTCNGSGTAFGPCTGEVTPAAETCDGLDNDCDGAVDEDDPGGGGACSTGQPGVCASGTQTCAAGSLVCQPNTAASPELCDGLDNDCDGSVDEGNPGGGGSCSTGQPGVCAAGTQTCQSGAVTCEPTTSPSAEVCDGLDNDCDG